MTETHTPASPAELSPKDARAGKPVKGMPFVLGISTIAVILLFVIVLAIFM